MATKNPKNTSSWVFVKWLLESRCSYVVKNHSSSFCCWRYFLFYYYYSNLNHYHSCHIIEYDFIFNFITILYFIMYHYCTIFLFIFVLLYLFVILSSILFHFFSFIYFLPFSLFFHASNGSIMCFIIVFFYPYWPLNPRRRRTPRPVRTIGETHVPFAWVLFKELATTTGTSTKTARKQ